MPCTFMISTALHSTPYRIICHSYLDPWWLIKWKEKYHVGKKNCLIPKLYLSSLLRVRSLLGCTHRGHDASTTTGKKWSLGEGVVATCLTTEDQ
jgi:hypothetical protein